MTNNTALARSMLIYAICLPLAIFLGYLITDPLDRTNDITLTVVLFLLVLPLLLRWYHAWLIVIWNMTVTFMYLPGVLPGWMPIAGVGFAVAVGHYILNRDRKFLHAPSVSWSLVVLALVVAITAKFRGGLGFRAFGNDSIGGKRYLWIWMAIVGYFALISQPIPPQKRKLYTTLFLLGSVTAVISFLGGYMGPAAGFINIFFPVAGDPNQMQSPMAMQSLERFGGVAAACIAVGYALVARYGIEGALDLTKLWRPFIFVVAFAASFFGGYRSTVILVAMVLGLVFFFEGLLRSRLMPIALLGIFLAGGVTVAFSDRMPLPVQRCLTLLPVKLDPVARLSAESSSDWRLEIWKALLPQVPQYLLLGKGLTFDANDMAMYVSLGNEQAGGQVGGGFALSADYHNGPLSLIIPFGIWGAIAFLWFLWASIKVLWKNYKYGDPEIKKINTFLLSFFIAKTIMFFLIFGGFYGDLVGFVGLVGFSISLNSGVAKPELAPARPQVVFNRFRPLSAAPVATRS
jgi:hypothetical protein